MLTRRSKRILLVGVLMVTAFCAVLILPIREYQRVASPNGHFFAVARSPLWTSLIPIMPGQSGDKPGWVIIYNKEGEFCGRAPVPMVSFIHDLRWSGDEAYIPVVAEWKLSQRKVTVAR
ncbi:hypothetical protein ACXR0O_11560 [Verrucomicrobiota bacterium sgz303538]